MQLTRAVLYSADASTPLRQADENVPKWTRAENLDQRNSLSGNLMRGSDGWEKFRRRRIVKLDYRGGKASEWWRITSISERREQRINLSLTPRYVELENYLAFVEAGGAKQPRVVVTGLSVSDALNRILNTLPAPDLYSPGTVDSYFSGEKVYVWGEGVSYWRLLNDVVSPEAGGVDGRLRFEWDGSQYLVHVEAPGQGKQTTITFTSLEEGIQGKDLSYTIDDSNYFSAVAAIGGSQNSRFTVAEARWLVSSASYDSTNDATTLTTDGVPIWDDGVLEGRYIEDDTGSTYEVLSTSKPDTVTVDGNASSATSFRFLDADKKDLVRLEDDRASRDYGFEEVVKRFGQVKPFENLLVRSGVDTSAETKTGWSSQGTVQTFDTIFDVTSTEHGSASIRVEADAAGSDPQNGIVANAIRFDKSEMGPYASAVVHVRVVSGAIAVELEDANGNIFPARGSEDEIVGTEDTLRGYQLGGMKPDDGDLKLRIWARDDGTEFHLDAAAITPSGSAQSYSALMGPRALWNRAALELVRNGGAQPPRLDVTTFTLNDVPGFRGTVRTGDFVRVITEQGLRLDPVRTRVQKVEEELSVGKEAHEQRVTIGKRPKSFVDRLRDGELFEGGVTDEPSPPTR